MEYVKNASILIGLFIQLLTIGTIFFLTWRSNRKDFNFIRHLISENKENTEKTFTRHENAISEIYDKIDDQILPAISDLQANVKKNCQALKDFKDDCKTRHYGINFSAPAQRQ